MNFTSSTKIIARFAGACVAGMIALAAVQVRAANSYTPYNFVTFAGGGGAGYADGTGGTALFNSPNGIVTDSSGNVFIADSANYVIRKITPAGVVTTFAGMPGTSAHGDGTGNTAMFSYPVGLAIDSADNLYVGDSAAIRKITPGAVVTTLAGGQYGSADGTGAAAQFNGVHAVAVDSSGNVYAADTFNHTIRKITPDGVVTTVAGQAGVQGSADGTGSAATFKYPEGITTDAAGNVYVADTANQTIRKITPDGVVTTIAGQAGVSGSTDATGSAATFSLPSGMTTDSSGNIYLADLGNDRIREITPAGVVTTLAGSFAGWNDGTGTNAQFFWPTAVTMDSSGNFYVSDNGNNTIRKIAPGAIVTTFAGSVSAGNTDATGTAARFFSPAGLAIDTAGNVYVADFNNQTIRKITAAGVVTTLAGSPGPQGFPGNAGSADGTGTNASFYNPSGVAVDASGNVYVADTSNFTIRKITPEGVVTTFAGQAGVGSYNDGHGTDALFDLPAGLATDSAGNIYVADTGNDVIRKITPGGDVTTVAGQAFTDGSADGNGGAALFSGPSGIAVDAAGNLYVSDSNNSTIRKITPAGDVTTIAGQAGVQGADDGIGTAATFSMPQAIAVDSSGNIFVADTWNENIRKITPDGVVTTLGDDFNGQTFFSDPAGLAVSSSGNLYVSDFNLNIISKGFPSDNCLPISVSPDTVADGMVGIDYNQIFTASGGFGPYTYTVTSGSLPSGLTLATDGALTGAPLYQSTNYFTITATDTNGCTGSTDYALVVDVGSCPPITLSPSSLPDGTLAVAYSQTISATPVSSYTYTVTSGSLPPGLTLYADGTLSGLPLAVTTNTFIVTATDVNNCSGSAIYTVIIGGTGNAADTNHPALTITSPKNMSAISDSAAVTVTGTAKDSGGKVKTGVAVVTYSFNGGSMQVPSTTDKFTNWTANVTLVPGWNSLVVRAVDYIGNTATVTNIYFYGSPTNVTGPYQGLFYQTDGNNNPVIAVQSAGAFNASVNIHRVYSGKLYLNGFNYPVKGTLDLAGNSTLIVSRATASLPDLTLNLHLDWTGVTREMTGTISCGSEGWTSSLLAIWTYKAK